MSEPVRNALLFLVNTLFDLYLILLIIRVILVWIGAHYYDPLTQFVTKLTDPVIKPLRRHLHNVGKIEASALLIILLLSLCKFLIIFLIYAHLPSISGVIVLACADFLRLSINVLFYAILFQALLSWIQPFSPFHRILNQFTAPIMRPFGRLLPPIGGIDLTPLLVLILLQVILILFITPLLSMGYRLAIH